MLHEAVSYFTQEVNMLSCLHVTCGRADEAYGAFGGVRNEAGEPLTSDNIFDLASLTKLFTGLTVMRLVEDGKLDLQKSVSYYLPAYVHLKEVTVHQLLGYEINLTTPGRIDAVTTA